MTEHDTPESDSISVIGMAGRFPGAADTATFWQNLVNGICSVRPFTDEELAAIDPAIRKHPNFVPVVADVADVDQWDPAFFSFSPSAAELMDPQNRLFLECSWQAMENAGYDPAGAPGVVGVVAGSGFPTYLMNNIFGHWDTMAEVGHMQLAIGNDRDSLSTMVAYRLNLRGPSFTVQTSCSTSMLAIHLACNSLLSYESDMMLAGGVAIQSPQAEGYVYEEGGIASPDGVIRSLDAKGQGGVFGNGVGVVVLKRTADALRDGDRIYAQILGSATNNDGLNRAGYAAPGLRGQSEVIAEAIANADVDPDSVSYVEAHGTATLLGDAIELDAISQAFKPRSPEAGPCAVGTVKPNVSHTDRASGVIGLIKTSLMLHHSVIPPQINFESPNANLDVASGAFRVVTEAEEWPAGTGPRRAVVNSFGMGGTNAVAVLQEAPERAERPSAGVPQVLVLSARSAEALDVASTNLLNHLRDNADLDLADVAFTLQAGRTAFNHRRVLACADLADAVAALSEKDLPRVHTRHQTHRSRGVVVLVPGDEPTDAELAAARVLHDSEPAFRAAFTSAAEALGLSAEQVWTAPSGGAVLRYALGELLLATGVPGLRFAGVGGGAVVADCLAGTSPLTALKNASGDAERAELAELAADTDLVLVELGDGRLLRALATGEPRDDDGSWLAALPASLVVAPGQAGVVVRELAGLLWLAGADPDWTAVHAGRQPYRVTLPTYPFERRRVWMDPPEGGVAKPPSRERHEDIARWFHAPAWRQAPRLAAAGLDTRLVEAGPWLVVGTEDAAELAEALRERLVGAGATVRVAVESPAEPVTLGETLPRTVIHLGAATDIPAPGLTDIAGFDLAQQSGFDSIRHLVGALVSDRLAEPPRLVVLTKEAVQLFGREQIRAERAGLIGLVRVLPQENPGLRCRVVDVDAALDVDGVLADAIEPDATTVAYRNGTRWQQDFEQFLLSETAGGAHFRPGGSYLITGGLGQVCLAVAGHLAAKYQARIALLARSPLPEESSWDAWLRDHPATDRTSIRIRAVRELRDAGAEVVVLAADVADAAQVAAAVARATAAFGELHGVIHGAGVQADEYFGLAHEMTVDQCREHYRAKHFGLASLAQAVDLDRLDFCVTLSSLATVLGAIGHAPYAAANAAMDGLAQALFESGHRKVLSVNWDSWPSAGDAPEFGSAPSTVAKYQMTYAEGIEALERALGAVGALPRLVNSTGDLGLRLDEWVNSTDGQDKSGDGERHPRPPLANPFVAPADGVERSVAEVWQEVLGLSEIGVLDNFFELGGHSLMGVRMISKLRKSVGVNVPIALLTECPTVRELSDQIKLLDPAAAGVGPTSAAGSV